MKHRILLIFLVLVLGLLPPALQADSFQVHQIATLSINSAITPATLDYLNHQLNKLPRNTLAVIKLNTPGGLVSTTKDIITLIGKQEYPIVVWISPEGASAASAGAIIASSAHFILMAPGTNIGAATPIGLGGDLKESDEKNKALNDLAALVRSLSNSRGRPAEPFEDMIKTARSLTDGEALKLKIIDAIISREGDIKDALQGKVFQLQGRQYTLEINEAAPLREYAPTAGQKILEVLASPATAYFLFLIGVALLYFELQAPGGFIAGAVGIGFLILAAIAFQVLPLNWGALGLIVLGIFLLVLEVFITSYGILGISGLACFIMGSLFLFHGESGFISIQYPVIMSTLAGVVTAMGLLLWYLYNDKKKQHMTGDFFLPAGAKGTVMTKNKESNLLQIKVRGEIWKAAATEDLSVGDPVEVAGVDQEHLLIKVNKIIKE